MNTAPLRGDSCYSPPTDCCYVGKCAQHCQIRIFSREPKIWILYAASQFFNAGNYIDLKTTVWPKYISARQIQPSRSPVCHCWCQTLIKTSLCSWQQIRRGRHALSLCVLSTFRNRSHLPSESQEIVLTPSCTFQGITQLALPET